MKFEATHGHTAQGRMSPEYRCWSNIKSRCLNPNHKAFHYYGGRGVAICEEWKEDFTAFLAYVGCRPSKRHSIDRHPNKDGNYEPGNVRWATKKEQTDNCEYTRKIEFNGKTRPVIDVARQLGISWRMVDGRLQRGWSVERALYTPRMRPDLPLSRDIRRENPR